jgi:hypothetical protein
MARRKDHHIPRLMETAFEAGVKRLNDDAGIPHDRVVEAFDLTP